MNRKTKKRILLGLLILALFLTVVPFTVGAGIYTLVVSTRMDAPENILPNMDDYPSLHRESYTVQNNQQEKLAAYLYTGEKDSHNGIVVLSHGMGLGGHIAYIDVIDFFAQNGYAVIAYDTTGCDASEGSGIHSFSQGLLDLDYVLRFVEEQPEFQGQKIFLWGHSWGGYNVCAVAAYHPEITAIAALSAYEDGMEPLRSYGIIGKIFAPYVTLFNQLKMGDVAQVSASDGLNTTSAPVLIAHGGQDATIRPSVGFNEWEQLYADNSRFTFIYLEDRGHLGLYSAPDTAVYRSQFEGENAKDFSELEHDKLYGANSELMQIILLFYEEAANAH